MSGGRSDPVNVENRIVLVTDAQPNMGDLNTTTLLKRLQDNAGRGVSTTIVGVGLDFNTELTEAR